MKNFVVVLAGLAFRNKEKKHADGHDCFLSMHDFKDKYCDIKPLDIANQIRAIQNVKKNIIAPLILKNVTVDVRRYKHMDDYKMIFPHRKVRCMDSDFLRLNPQQDKTIQTHDDDELFLNSILQSKYCKVETNDQFHASPRHMFQNMYRRLLQDYKSQKKCLCEGPYTHNFARACFNVTNGGDIHDKNLSRQHTYHNCRLTQYAGANRHVFTNGCIFFPATWFSYVTDKNNFMD
jgi:hypothetical protein